MKETDLNIDFRAVYLFTSGQTCSMYLVQNDFMSKKLGEVQGFNSDQNIKSIVLNCKLQADEDQSSEIQQQQLISKVAEKGYRPIRKYFVKEDGTTTPTDFVFITGTVRSTSGKMGYKVCSINKGNISELFTIVPQTGVKLEDMHIINFEIERFLNEYEVVYLDEVDIKWLFEVAVEYLQDERRKAKEKEEAEGGNKSRNGKRFFAR